MTLRVAVAGASGFVGRAVVAELVERGDAVLAMSRGRSESLPDGAQWAPWSDVVNGPMSAVPSGQQFDAVVNAVASRQHRVFPGGVPDLLEANVAATAHLLAWADRCGARAFVQISTGSVYGPGEPQREDAPARPDSFWAATRRATEQLAVDATAAFDSVHVTRLYFPYGPGQQDRLITNLAARIRAGKSIELAGNDGGMLLAPTFVGDVSALISDLCGEPATSSDCVLNVAGPQVVSIAELAEQIGEAIGVAPTYVRQPDRPVVAVVPDYERLHRIRPAEQWTSLTEGLHRTFA